jgi:hypothetical protein
MVTGVSVLHGVSILGECAAEIAASIGVAERFWRIRGVGR